MDDGKRGGRQTRREVGIAGLRNFGRGGSGLWDDGEVGRGWIGISGEEEGKTRATE